MILPGAGRFWKRQDQIYLPSPNRIVCLWVWRDLKFLYADIWNGREYVTETNQAKADEASRLAHQNSQIVCHTTHSAWWKDVKPTV